MKRLFALIVLPLVACDAYEPVPVGSIVMSARALPQTQAEIAFAMDLFNGLQELSITDEREYCGLIGVDETGRYVATPPRRGAETTCLPPASPGQGVTVLASYHTHGHYKPAYLTEIPSFDDIRTDIEDDTDGYVATPGGRLWYVDARAQEARLICGAQCLVSDLRFQEDPEFPVLPQYTLDDLRQF